MSSKKATGYRLPATGKNSNSSRVWMAVVPTRPPFRTSLYITRHASRLLAMASLVVASTVLADGLVDPTRPPVVARKAGPAAVVVEALPRVTAIFQTGERRVAVFDGQVVNAGDRIGDVVIEAILTDGVRYRRGGRVEFARLPKQAASVRQKVDSEESEP